MTIRDQLLGAEVTFTKAKVAYTAKLTVLVGKVNANLPLTNADWADLVVNLYDPMTVASDALRPLIPDQLRAVETSFTTAKKNYTTKLTAVIVKVNARQPVTNADWTDLVVNFYDPMTIASDALRAGVTAMPTGGVQYDSGELRFYHIKHGATIAASGPGDIPPGGAFLVDKGGGDGAAKFEFGKALADGNFVIMRNGTAFSGIGFTATPYAGTVCRINHGAIAIRDKVGTWVYGTPPAEGDKEAMLT